jgi:hypothetical protein
MTLSEKQTKAKRAGGMTQVVECLPSKYKTLNSNHSTAKKKKKKKKEMTFLAHLEKLNMDWILDIIYWSIISCDNGIKYMYLYLSSHLL